MPREKRRSIAERLADFQTEIRRLGMRRPGEQARPAAVEARRQLQRHPEDTPTALRPKPVALLVELALHELWRRRRTAKQGRSDTEARDLDAERHAADKKAQTADEDRPPDEPHPHFDDDPDPETAGAARPLP